MSNPYLSSAEAAEYLGLSVQTVIHLAQTDQLRASFVSRRWRFRLTDIDTFVESRVRGA